MLKLQITFAFTLGASVSAFFFWFNHQAEKGPLATRFDAFAEEGAPAVAAAPPAPKAESGTPHRIPVPASPDAVTLFLEGPLLFSAQIRVANDLRDPPAAVIETAAREWISRHPGTKIVVRRHAAGADRLATIVVTGPRPEPAAPPKPAR